MAGVVHITIESAADLKDNSLLKMMDPYVAVRLGHQKAKTNKRQQGSSSTHPVFKQTLTLPLPQPKVAAAPPPPPPAGMHHGGPTGATCAPHYQQQQPAPMMPGMYPAAAAQGAYPACAYPAAAAAAAAAPQPCHPYPIVLQQLPGGGYAPVLNPYAFHLPADATAHISKQHKQHKGSDGSKDKHKGKKGDKHGESKPGQLEICVMAGLKRERKVRKAAEVAFAGAKMLMSMMGGDEDSGSNNNDEEDKDEKEEKDKLIGKATVDLTPFINGTASPQQQLQLPLISKKGKHNGFVQLTLRVEAKPAATSTNTGTHAALSTAPPPPSAMHAQQHYNTAAAAAAAPPQHPASSGMCAYSYQPQASQPFANMGQAC